MASESPSSSSLDKETFEEHVALFSKDEEIKLILPESIYGVAIVIPVYANKFDLSNFPRIWIMLTQIFWMVMSVLFQFMLFRYVNEINNLPCHVGVCRETDTLLIMSMLVWSFIIYNDIFQSIAMIRWLYLAPAMHSTKNVFYKLFGFFVVVLPKILIGIIAWWYGMTYLIQSCNAEQTILHTVKLYYILNIDEFFYAAFTPAFIKRDFQKVWPVVGSPSLPYFYFDRLVAPVGKMVLVLAIVYVKISLTECRVYSWKHMGTCGGEYFCLNQSLSGTPPASNFPFFFL